MLELSTRTFGRAGAALAAIVALSFVIAPCSAAVPEFAQTTSEHHGTIVSNNQIRARVSSYGRKVELALRKADPLSVYNQFNPAMQKRTPKLKFVKVFEDLEAKSVVGERYGESVRSDGYGDYIYLAEYQWDANILLVVVGYDKFNKISGIYFRPLYALPDDPKAFYLDKADYRLPFDGVWWVYWGGDNDLQNYHVFSPDQRHAYDIGIVQNDSTHRDPGTSDSDYYCFGKPISSPTNGKVVEAVDGVDDNVPGTHNAKAPAGNHVIINCGQGEYLLMAHFKDHSLKVHAGEIVKRGQLIGDCGNSGNTSEPHLHIQLQDVPTLAHATSLPLYFEHFVKNGEKVRLGQVAQCDYIHK